MQAAGERNGEPVGDLSVRHSQLHGTQVSGEMVVRTVLTGMATDLRSGEVIRGAAGLAVWPKLTYRTRER